MDDATLLCQFEARTLPHESWTHRAHLRVAYLYLRSHNYAEALELIRANIQAYNQANGIETTPTTGYHETMTQVWLRLVAHAMRGTPPETDSEAFLDANPSLLEKHTIFRYYTRETLESAGAREGFVRPEFAPLPGSMA